MAQLSDRLKRIVDENAPEHMRPYLYRMVAKEGGGGGVSSTGARGPLQFTRGTGKAYGLVGPQGDIRDNEVANIQAGVKLTNDNAATLRRYLGRDPTHSELALAHQQGADTAGRMLTGTGNAPRTNLAVNNVDPNATPQEAASKIMNYYGFDKQIPGLTMAGMFNPNAPGAFATPFAPPAGATPEAPGPIPGLAGFAPPGISLASNPVSVAAPATLGERLMGADGKGGKGTPFSIGMEGAEQLAKGFKQTPDPKLNEIIPSSSGVGVDQRIAASAPLAQNMLTEMIKRIQARRP